jgi:hypothetical protein
MSVKGPAHLAAQRAVVNLLEMQRYQAPKQWTVARLHDGMRRGTTRLGRYFSTWSQEARRRK